MTSHWIDLEEINFSGEIAVGPDHVNVMMAWSRWNGTKMATREVPHEFRRLLTALGIPSVVGIVPGW